MNEAVEAEEEEGEGHQLVKWPQPHAGPKSDTKQEEPPSDVIGKKNEPTDVTN